MQIENKWEEAKKKQTEANVPSMQLLKGKLTKENCLIMVLMGILFLIIVWPVENEKKQMQSSQSDSKENILDLQMRKEPEAELAADWNTFCTVESISDYTEYLEGSLEKLLSTMDGVGKVQVMITLEGTGESIVEKDTNTKTDGSTEVDSVGGSRNTTGITEEETTVFYEAADGETPFVRKVTAPEVEGVVVSAQGGGNVVIAENIKEAIQALFGIDAHKIIIVKMISQ